MRVSVLSVLVWASLFLMIAGSALEMKPVVEDDTEPGVTLEVTEKAIVTVDNADVAHKSVPSSVADLGNTLGEFNLIAADSPANSLVEEVREDVLEEGDALAKSEKNDDRFTDASSVVKMSKWHKLLQEKKIVPFPKIGKPAIIKIQAREEALVLLNGKIVGRVGWPGKTQKRFSVLVHLEDVIGVFIKSKKRGEVIMNVRINGRNHVTGSSKRFKARGNFNARDLPKKSWLKKGFSSCNWNPARAVSRKRVRGFPRHARKVWARKAKRKGIMLLRYVVGGERCNKRPKKPTKPTLPMPQTYPPTTGTIGGQSDSMHCPCRPIPNENSYCYEMKNMYVKKGRCSRRKCETKYECVPGDKSLPDCVKRISKYQVVHVGWKICKKLRVDPPTMFWVRY